MTALTAQGAQLDEMRALLDISEERRARAMAERESLIADCHDLRTARDAALKVLAEAFDYFDDAFCDLRAIGSSPDAELAELIEKIRAVLHPAVPVLHSGLLEFVCPATDLIGGVA